MRLTEAEADIVRDTFRRATADQARAAEIVYRRLFEIAPQTESLFVTDMHRQGVKVISTLGALTAQMQSWDMLGPTVEDMARRHLAYGVKAEHYEAFGEALIGALAELLEDDFDDAARGAWLRAYRLLSDFMIDAAYSEPPAELTGR